MQTTLNFMRLQSQQAWQVPPAADSSFARGRVYSPAPDQRGKRQEEALKQGFTTSYPHITDTIEPIYSFPVDERGKRQEEALNQSFTSFSSMPINTRPHDFRNFLQDGPSLSYQTYAVPGVPPSPYIEERIPRRFQASSFPGSTVFSLSKIISKITGLITGLFLGAVGGAALSLILVPNPFTFLAFTGVGAAVGGVLGLKV